ncbi:MAG: C-terminal binding protein [Candidatus Bathyarchaeia archaeon]
MAQKRKFKVVITDCVSNLTLSANIEQRILSKVGAVVEKYQYGLPRDEARVREIVRHADVVLSDTGPITRSVISNMARARGIVSYGAGYDHIDVKTATERGIVVCSVPDYLTYEVADHTLALILALNRKILRGDRIVRTSRWTGWHSWMELKPIQSMDGMTAGIIGFGTIGRQVAERLKAFKLKLLTYDPYVNSEEARRLRVKAVDLQTLLQRSDIITLHVPLTEETRHLISKRELQLMKREAVLINTSRGKVVDLSALREALTKRRIGGAGLDVLETFPLHPDDQLLKLDNVIFTPHMAWYSEASARRTQKLAAEEAARILRGESVRHPVNLECLKRHD